MLRLFTDRARPVALMALLAIGLSGCAGTATPASAPTAAPATVPTALPTIAAPTTAPTIAAPTSAPTIAAPTTAPTIAAPTVAAPTAVSTADQPTSAPTQAPTAVLPPTAIPVEADTPGPGWVFALTGDANRDGVADAVFYQPAAVAADVQFEEPERAAVAVAAEQIVVVQRSAAGLETLLQINRDGGWADQSLFDFAGRRSPAGYLLALDPARGPLFTLLPYGAGGVDTGGLIGIDWSTAEAAFRIVAEHP